jgi:Kef-type K+ transport system membrane component KefB
MTVPEPELPASAPAGPLARSAGPLAYLLLLFLGIAVFLAICSLGETLEAPPKSLDSPPSAGPKTGEVDVVLHVLATLSAIIALGFLISRPLRWLGQPPVIGEVLAGILLGPSLLGALSPELAAMFVPGPDVDPAGTVEGALRAVSRLGIVFYMFLVGLELDVSRLRTQARTAAAVSHASILVPFVLGAAIALWLYPRFSSADVSFTSFALFLGIAMAITAFPVLARILTDQKLNRTELGVMALTCAATGDMTAWCLLPLVIGAAQAGVSDAAKVVLGAAAFIAVVFLVVRPLARRLIRRVEHGPSISWALPAVVVAILLAALITKLIGIHTALGGFLLGAAMPHQGRFAEELHRKLHDIATIVLLPAFFAITGLRTQIGLLQTPYDWLVAGAIILVATVGKVGGTAAAARGCGMPWREASALGMLMNTRGLMELIVLNIGLDLGVISPTLYAMMVIMALATTLMTAPVVNRLLKEAA